MDHDGLKPTDSEWPCTLDEYEVGPLIGSGASATVHKGVRKDTGEPVAIKMVELETCKTDIEEILKEMRTMKMNLHPHVIKYHVSFVHQSKLIIVMPLLLCSAHDCMQSIASDGFDEPVISTLLASVLDALCYFHSHGHVHRDVKGSNILLSDTGNVLLSDFGVSALTMTSSGRHNCKTFVGTPCWMAPEVIEQSVGYNEKADIWSFGITALELAHGHAPNSSVPPMKVLLKTLQDPPPQLESKYSRPFREMVESCLQKEPSKRPTAQRLRDCKFLVGKARKPEFIVSNVIKYFLEASKTMDKLVHYEQVPSNASTVSAHNEEIDWNFDLGSRLDIAKEIKGEVPEATGSAVQSPPVYKPKKEDGEDQKPVAMVQNSASVQKGRFLVKETKSGPKAVVPSQPKGAAPKALVPSQPKGAAPKAVVPSQPKGAVVGVKTTPVTKAPSQSQASASQPIQGIDALKTQMNSIQQQQQQQKRLLQSIVSALHVTVSSSGESRPATPVPPERPPLQEDAPEETKPIVAKRARKEEALQMIKNLTMIINNLCKENEQLKTKVVSQTAKIEQQAQQLLRCNAALQVFEFTSKASKTHEQKHDAFVPLSPSKSPISHPSLAQLQTSSVPSSSRTSLDTRPKGLYLPPPPVPTPGSEHH